MNFPFPHLSKRYPRNPGERVKQIQFDVITARSQGGVAKPKKPTITADNNPYTDPVTITITHPNPSATIKYTTNGTDPTEASATYPGAFQLTGATAWTVKAIAVVGTKISKVAALVVTRSVVANPVMSPAGGTVYESASVTLTCATAGATMRYTTNGTTPTPSVGTVYSGAFTVAADATVKAIAYKTGMTNSSVISHTFDVTGYRVYYGATVDATLTDTTLMALSGQNNNSSPDATYAFGANTPDKYLYVAWKASLGRDPITGTGFRNDFGSLLGDMADTAPYDNEINGWYYDEITVLGEVYRVFRTKNLIGLAMNVYVETEAEAPAP